METVTDFLPLLAAGLGVAGVGYLGLSFLVGDKPAPEPPVVEMVTVEDAEAVVEEDIIVLDLVGDRYEIDPSAPRFSITM